MKIKFLIIIGIIIASGFFISTSGMFTPFYSDINDCYYEENGERYPCRIIDGWYDVVLFYPESSLSEDETEFLQIKNNMENVGYDICDIQLKEGKIFIHLMWIFEGSDAEKKIVSKIPSDVDYEIIYHEGYSDYFINLESKYDCQEPIGLTDTS